MRDKLGNYSNIDERIQRRVKSMNSDFEEIKILRNPVQDEKPFYSGKREDVLLKYITYMVIDNYGLITAKYSLGCELSEIYQTYQMAIDYLKELATLREDIVMGISKERYIELFAMSILFEVPKEELVFFVKHADAEKLDELIFDYMVNGCGLKRTYNSTEHFKKDHKFSTDIVQMAQTDHKKASEVFVKYMSKKWFKDYSGSWGKDVHLSRDYEGFWSYEAAAIAKILNLDDSALKEDTHYPYELRHYKNEMTFTPSKMLDVETKKVEYKVGIPKFPKLEQVVAPPFHEEINQFLIDFKKLSDLEFYKKYELDEIWYEDEYDEYVKDKNAHGFLGFMLVQLLINCGQILPIDPRENVEDYTFDSYWDGVPVKLICFDLEDDQAYYSYIPQSTDLKSIFDVKIENIHIGLLEQGGITMEM